MAVPIKTLSEDDIRQIASDANRNRIRVLRMIRKTKLGHVGGDFSAMDILMTLYRGVLRFDPKNPKWADRDRFIMSKGHCSGAFYATMASAGYLTDADLDTYMMPESKLNGHPSSKLLDCVETSSGALGHGLPVGVGAAIAAKIQKASWRVFVLTGDGELQEGSNWEAAMCAGHRGLDNLTIIVDRNRQQQGDWTEQTNRLDPLADRFRAFGCAVAETDGHDPKALLETFAKLPLEEGKPSVIIARTNKGRGASMMEDQMGWHHRVPTEEEFALAVKELEAKL